MPRPRWSRARRGSYVLLFAVCFIGLLGVSGLAIDSGIVRLTETQAQVTADAAAHGALVVYKATADTALASEAAVAVAAQNVVLGQAAVLDPATDLTFGEWDFSARTFDAASPLTNGVSATIRKTDASANGSIPLLFGRMFGADSAETQATSPATGALRPREIMVVMDITGSFQQEMPFARQAALDLLDILYANVQPTDRIGMVTFVGAGRVWTPLTHLQTGYTGVRAQWSTLDWCNRNYSPFIGTVNYHNAPQMMDCRSGSGSNSDSGTNQGAGLNLAISQLTASGDPFAQRTIILVSDGRPECVPSSTTCNNNRATYGRSMADAAAAANISLFSVSFNDPFNATQSTYMASLVRGYGAFYETPDKTELPLILQTIAEAIPVALVD